MLPTNNELVAVFEQKYSPLTATGWGPRLRAKFGYFTPDDVYESLISRLVTTSTVWLDIGGGRDLLPTNPELATMLASRCRLLVGVDPSDNIQDNHFVHQRAQTTIDGFQTDRRFDLITMRMVAEHITDPIRAAGSIAGLLSTHGRVVIYTVNKWSAVTMTSWLVPFCLHHRIKSLLWGSEERDTFPVAYKMNTRGTLRKLFEAVGLQEEAFLYVDDCRTFARWRALSTLEILIWRLLRSFGMHYPETCLLAVYRTTGTIADSATPL